MLLAKQLYVGLLWSTLLLAPNLIYTARRIGGAIAAAPRPLPRIKPYVINASPHPVTLKADGIKDYVLKSQGTCLLPSSTTKLTVIYSTGLQETRHVSGSGDPIMIYKTPAPEPVPAKRELKIDLLKGRNPTTP